MTLGKLHERLAAGGIGLILALTAQPALAEFSSIGCTFRDNDVSKLKDAIEDALDLHPSIKAQVPIIIVPTFEENLGQPGDFMGVAICTNQNTTVVPVASGIVESDPFPADQEPVDVDEIQQTSYVKITRTDGTEVIRICQTDQTSACVEVTKK